MAQPLKRDDWRILVRILRWLRRVDIEALNPEDQLQLTTERMDFVNFAINLRALTKDLPKEKSSDEDSEVEAGSEGDDDSETDEEENEQEVSPS